MLLNLYVGRTTDGRSVPFRCLLHLLVQGHQCPLLCFVETLQFLPGMLKDQEPVWIKSLHSCRCWCSGRQVVRRYHNSPCREALEAFLGLPDLGLFSQLSKYQNIWSISFWVKGFVLYCTVQHYHWMYGVLMEQG